jgi:Fe-S cluster assembly iron-binding protein IscA
MNSKVKIKVSEEAYKILLTIVKHDDDHYIRFVYKDGCCGSSKVDIYLDQAKDGDIIDRIEELPVLYDKEVVENIKEITLVYRKSSFMIKTITNKELFKNCSTCAVGCGKHSGGHGACPGCK